MHQPVISYSIDTRTWRASDVPLLPAKNSRGKALYAPSTTRCGTMRMLVAKFEKFGEVFMIN